ncbi:MAG: T9SS type A sorting domain-containing protein [Bacteroidetes bacterium]|nr:T9SS type A sorting domain-containing protein [Bacteroidota bacterium]HET6244472.1 T9SS type A sorting domain-containing protein [Bacteroidia bacterium]
MRMLFIVLMIILFQVQSKAQDWEWVIEGEGIENLQTAADEEGNLFASGNFKSSCKLGEVTITSPEKSACFVLRYDEAGNILWWKTIGSTDTLAMVELKAKAGVAYIGGNFKGTLKSSLGISPSAGGMDIFLASFDKEGDLKMVKRDGGPEREELVSLAFTGEDLIVIGSFSVGGKIGNINFTSQSTRNNSYYLKMDTLGNYEWIKEFLGGEDSYSFARMAVTDSKGNIYISCGIQNIRIGEVDTTFNSCDKLLKFSPQGDFLEYLYCISNPGHSTKSIHIDSDGFFYRFFRSSIRYIITSLSKYSDSSGNANWIYSINAEPAYPLSLEVKEDKILIFTSVNNYNNENKNGLLIQEFNTEGKLINFNLGKVESAGTFYSISPHNIFSVSSDFVIISGALADKISFGAQIINENRKQVQYIAKIAKNHSFETQTGFDAISRQLSESLHPNPTSSHFTLSFEAEKADVTITDFSGRIMLQRQVKSNENISTQGFSKGIYFVQVKVGEELVRRKLVVN